MGTTKSNVGAYLSSEGLRPKETDFGFVFEYQKLTFFIFWDDDDNQYLKIALPGIYNVDDNNREDALAAANEVNIEWKVIKTVVLSDEVVFQYKCDNFYAPQADAGIQLLDEELGIDWRIPTAEALLSEKDLKHPCLRDAVLDFDIKDKLY